MKLLRTIRLDPSDTFVFERAAEPGEWAVSGAFMFCRRRSCRRCEGKARAAFRSGFLGVASLGWSTLVQIVEASDDDRARRDRHAGASSSSRISARPIIEDAVAAAEEEFAFAASLCNHPPDTLIAVHRSHDGGEIREAFRTLASARTGRSRCARSPSSKSRARTSRPRRSI